MTKKTEAAVTSIETLKSMCASELVELPGWQPGKTVTFRLRMSSLRGLARMGKIPNPLLAAAQKLYEGQASSAKATFSQLIEVMNIVVGDAMVEPKLKDLQDAEIELTEDQFGMIWQYAQRGAAALETFRKKPSNPTNDTSGENVEGAAQ